MSKPIEVFWAPAPFKSTDQQFNFEYDAPVAVLNPFGKGQTNKEILACPAVRDTVRNLYAFKSPLGDRHKFPPGKLAELEEQAADNTYFRGEGGRISLIKIRRSGLHGYINLNYNISWVFHASEPLTMKTSAPHFPATTPAPGTYMVPGQLDVGRWFRQINLDYHVPVNAKEFYVQKNDPLMFMDFQTDRKIKFRRFIPTPELQQLALEFADSSVTHRRSSMAERYEYARRSKMDLVAKKLIQDAVVE